MQRRIPNPMKHEALFLAMAAGYHTQDVASYEHCQTSKMCILWKKIKDFRSCLPL